MYRTVTQTNNTKSQAQLELIREQRRKAEAQLKQLQEQEQALLLGRANRDLNSNQFTGGGPEVFTHLNGFSQAAPVMHQANPTSRQEPPIFNYALSYLNQVKNSKIKIPIYLIHTQGSCTFAARNRDCPVVYAHEIHAYEMRTPMRCTPVRYMPVRCTPMRCTPDARL
jgi:hypothetical protein